MRYLFSLVLISVIGCGSEGSSPAPSIASALDPVATTAVCESSQASETSVTQPVEKKAEEKVSKKNCKDVSPAKVAKGETFPLCNGEEGVGTMEVSVTTVVAAPAATSYQQCTANAQTDCIANSTYGAYDGSSLTAGNIKLGVTVGGVEGSYAPVSYPDCSANNQTGCIATSSYPANNLTLANLVPANIRGGVVIGTGATSVTGTYSPIVESHSDCTAGGQTGCIATATYPTESHVECTANGQQNCALTSTWKAIGGVSYSNIISSNIKSGIVIAGVTGSVIAAVAPNAFDVRKGTVINGTTGLLQTRCRNSEAGAPASEKCDTTGWLELGIMGQYIWYSDRMSGLQWYKLGPGITRDGAVSLCASLAEDGGGWRLPSVEELQQATLNRIQSVNGLKLELDILGYWSSSGSLSGTVVSYNGSTSSVLATSTTYKAVCVK